MSLSSNYILARQEVYSRSVQSIKESKQVVLITSYWEWDPSTVLIWENLKVRLRNAEVRKEQVLKGKIVFKTILKFATKSFFTYKIGN